MPNLCFYFEVHQPRRLKPYSRFEVGRNHNYFDDTQDEQIMKKVAQKCYLPANRAILKLIKHFRGRFKVAYSITGCALEQMEKFAPEVLWSFQELAATHQVEFIAETYYHSLSSIQDENEFREQVIKHVLATQKYFGQKPKIFRNTELIYNDRIGQLADDMGFEGILAEGADDILGWKSPNFLYKHPDRNLNLFLKNYRLSDDIAFRFSDRVWREFPLNAEKFSKWIHQINGNGELVNLFMDYETFGEHQWEETGIFNFLKALPKKILDDTSWKFSLPSEVVRDLSPASPISFERTVSWADMERDLTAWTGNQMQQETLNRLFELSSGVKSRNNPKILDHWRKLQTSDHFYYMCTKWYADGDVHAYFSPYESPYNAYINYMNVLNDFEKHVLKPSLSLSKASDKSLALI